MSTTNYSYYCVTTSGTIVRSGTRARGRAPTRNKGVDQNIGTGHQFTLTDIGGKVTAADGTQWEVVGNANKGAGRIAAHNIVHETSGPTPHAQRHILEGSVKTAFNLLIDDSMIRHIKKCTEAEACRKLQTETWSISVDEINAFLSILYARGVIARGISVDNLWCKPWGAPFFSETMPRRRFKEIYALYVLI